MLQDEEHASLTFLCMHKRPVLPAFLFVWYLLTAELDLVSGKDKDAGYPMISGMTEWCAFVSVAS